MANSEIEQLSIDTIRTLSMDAVQQANAGHPGTAMALAPLAYLLYTEVLRHNPANPHWPNRDRFVLSAGHACILQYSALHLSGYNLSLEELKRFRQWQSATPGHPEFRHTEGVEVTTGPLGQGFANGVGLALRRALPRRGLQPAPPRCRRPPCLRHLLGRRPDGGPVVRGGLARRHERAREARLLLRRQPHHDRRHDRDLVHRGSRQALRGARAGTSSTSPTRTTSRRCARRSQTRRTSVPGPR